MSNRPQIPDSYDDDISGEYDDQDNEYIEHDDGDDSDETYAHAEYDYREADSW